MIRPTFYEFSDAIEYMEELEAALIRCAEIAGEDGEAIEAARSGAMKQPTLAEFAVRAVRRLREDADEYA